MKLSPVVLTGASLQNVKVLTEFAEFWKTPYSTSPLERACAVFYSGPGHASDQGSAPLILCPSSWDEAKSIAARFGLKVTLRNMLLKMPLSAQAAVSARIAAYEFRGPRLEPVISTDEITVLAHISDTKTYLLSVDIVSECSKWLYSRLDDQPSRRFTLATKLPFSYSTIPRFIRNRSFRSSLTADDITEDRLGPVELLRTLFLACLVLASEAPIARLWFWSQGKSSALAITHDVETRGGLLRGTKNLSNVEETLGVHATWNVPTARYPIAPGDLDNILKHGELGGHDTTHDGRLALLKPAEAAERLKTCKGDLQQKAGVIVRGFRAPLLQHSRNLLSAASEAGFTFDSSVPSWEPLSPTSLREHGAGTVFPFHINEFLEIPVSLPQDHQLIRVMGLTPADAVERLLKVGLWIQSLGGAAVLLVHPDYEFASSFVSEYERLLKGLAQPSCQVMTLGELADWWNFRASARIDIHNGRVALQLDAHEPPDSLEIQLVTGYGRDGFKVGSIK